MRKATRKSSADARNRAVEMALNDTDTVRGGMFGYQQSRAAT